MSVESERAIIAAVSTAATIDPAEGLRVLESSRVRAEDFTLREHADLWQVAVDFLGRGVALEIYAVHGALKASAAVERAGGKKFLEPLLMDFKHDGRAMLEHARTVRDAALRRRALASLRDVAGKLKSTTPVAEVLSVGSEAWQALSSRDAALTTAEGKTFELATLLDDVQNDRRVLCVETGVEILDRLVGGLQPGVLTMVGALPGAGKSALLATIARNIANRKTRVGFFSLEDSGMWLARRYASLESGVMLFLIATKKLNLMQDAAVKEGMPRVYATLENIVIDDRQAMTPSEVAASARDMILNHGCKVILVDHLGEMRLERSERYDLDVSAALASLRDIAKRYDVPMVVASHVRRRQGLDSSTAPSLTDFANSSAPERMARVALGLSVVPGGIRLTILKQTNGPAGMSEGLMLLEASAMVSDSQCVLLPEDGK